MSLLSQKKDPLYNVMNELLELHGESVKKASQHQSFTEKVTPEVAELFGSETGTNELLEICQILISGYEKGIYKREDLYAFRDLMVQLRGKIIKRSAEEEIISLHETIGNVLKTGLYGKHVGDAAAELRDENKVIGNIIVAYLQREE